MKDLVLLHGFTGAPASFDGVLAALAARTGAFPPAHRLTLLGHGAPSDDLATRWPEEVARLADRIATLAAGPVHLVGYSLGARLALGLLLDAPALVASATLIGASPGLANEGERAARRAADEAWATLLEAEGMEAFVRAWEAQAIFDSQRSVDAADLARQRALRLRHRAAGLVRSLRVTGLGAMPDLTSALRRITVPVDMVVGARDQKFVALAHAMAVAIPRAAVLVVDEAGHNVPLEAPAALSERIAAALKKETP